MWCIFDTLEPKVQGMILNRQCAFLLLISSILACNPEPTASSGGFAKILMDTPEIEGRPEYLTSPFVTAGDRVYMVGHQDGSFPEIGWHIKGEMGGIWDHPIKLMDGFSVLLRLQDKEIPLRNAVRFTNYPMANRHDYELDSVDLQIERWQFVPDGKEGLVVEFVLHNTGVAPVDLEFEFLGHADLRPTWLGERTRMFDGRDQAIFDQRLDAWVVRDSLNPWHVLFGSDHSSDSHSGRQPAYAGKGTSSGLTYALHLSPDKREHLRIVIAGSHLSEADAKSTYSDIKKNTTELLASKRTRYADLSARSRLRTPDSVLDQTFEWLKYNADWLIQEVPGIGRGVTAGIPDYPWWFGVDSEYALQGYMAVGQGDIVRQTIEFLDSVSEVENGNGRIIHEMSTNGAVFNPGNINETPQFATLIWRVYQWNGDREFLQKYFPTIRAGLHWLMAENDGNRNGFPDGFGMMEIHGLASEMIDVAAYTPAAFHHASLIAQELGEGELATEYLQKALDLQVRINRDFWSEEFSSFADFIGTDEQALHLIDDAIIRADTLEKPWAMAELEQTREKIRKNPSGDALKPFVLHHNWVVNTPMEMGIADPEKALMALETARRFVNPFGMFVTGIDRDETAGTDDGSFQGSKVFSYTGAVMTLPTGVQAVAENNYGRPDHALDYLRRMTRSFSYALPGSMYEVSPDYGMMAQAWNIYSFAVPIVRQFFGVEPMVSRKQVRIRPLMPASWDHASLENVIMGENSLSIYYERDAGTITLRVLQEKDWEMQVALDGLKESDVKLLRGDGLFTPGEGGLILSGSNREIQIQYAAEQAR